MSDFPRLAFDGSLWAAGDPNLVIGGAAIVADAIQPQWLHPTSCVVYSRHSDGALMCVDAPFVSKSAPRCLRAAGGNVVAAANGKWVIEPDDPPRLIFAEWGSLAQGTPRGTVIAGPGFNGGSGYQHDARPLNPDTIRVVFGDNGQIRVVDVKVLDMPEPTPSETDRRRV